MQLSVLSLHSGSTAERQVLFTDTLRYAEDTSHHLARFLVSSVNNSNALNDLREVKSAGFDLNNEDMTSLDARLMKVFLDTKLPRDWNLLGDDYNLPGTLPLINTHKH